MTVKLENFLIDINYSIKEAMKRLTAIGQKTLFVVNKNNKLIGALSDGDIRRWILQGGSLTKSVITISNNNPKHVKEKYSSDHVQHLMVTLLIECVPVVNENMEIIQVLTWENVFGDGKPKQKEQLSTPVVIMAGGKGTRLDPFTRILPKPLIPINDKPIIEIIMDRFNEYGIKDFYISINHKSRMIKAYFEEMNDKYNVKYIEEEVPLGTAGALKFFANGNPNESFMITNCDIIIESDYAEIYKFHQDNNHDITLVVSCRHYIIPYGVCEIENGGVLKEIKEKPVQDLLVNTGMYLINRKVFALIPEETSFNVTDLIAKAKEQNYKVGVFPISEKSWIDIGQWEEYHKAINKMGENQ